MAPSLVLRTIAVVKYFVKKCNSFIKSFHMLQ